MPTTTSTQIREASNLLQVCFAHAREALAGRQEFRLDTLRALAALLEKMAPLVAQAAEMRFSGRDLSEELHEYVGHLGALQNVLEQLRFMLVARQSSLQASRCHAENLQLWATRLTETR